VPTTRLELALVVVLALAVPLGLRPVASYLAGDAKPSYLPSLDPFHERRPFNPATREHLRGYKPRFVFIGDSMLGSRIDPQHMWRRFGHTTWWVMQPGTGSAYWYLALKNVVLGAGFRPKTVFFFFRDDNLTDIMFRLDPAFRWSVDTVAGETEPELDAAVARRQLGGWHPVHRAIERATGAGILANRAERWLRGLPARLVAGEERAGAFDQELNALFAFDRLRPTVATDMAAVDETRLDFSRAVEASILPDILRLGREHGIRLCFVRVQRRPRPDGPPVDSPAMARYVADLRAYLESSGAGFHDFTGDPDYTLEWYKDGDHMGGWMRRRYTELFAAKLAPYFE
jgi:hypothetical protein